MKFEDMNKAELYEIAKKFNIKNRSAMTKEELANALSKYENTVSSKTTVQETVSSHVTAEAKTEPQPLKKEYPIPDIYNINTVVLLPVNPKKEYVYWEVSDKTMNEFCRSYNTADPIFILKVFTGEEDNIAELASVRVGKYGNWYFDLYCPDQRLWAEIGMLDSMGNYHTISTSKRIKMPTDRISDLIDEETWMTVGENIEKIYHLSGVTDLQKEELLSSARMHSELFKKLHQTEGGMSSSSLTRKGGE
ncbi:DUF4912 domain-containing protein [Seleniivibrio woodruffii]|uniref:DUF4912 domain-containing protein n=1 Tax=Seleniivibrio woodruffii TaxID=1078050 RepID=UPI002408F779|nr:DUF4912 domain-containing protein [Seleniivibrio woodruffii]